MKIYLLNHFSPDDTEKVGEPLLYGDDFALQCYESHKDIPVSAKKY